jgi:Ni,Fe-hydrogenase I cytochrome b subunit
MRNHSWSKAVFISLKTILIHETNVVEGYSMNPIESYVYIYMFIIVVKCIWHDFILYIKPSCIMRIIGGRHAPSINCLEITIRNKIDLA